MVLKKGEQLWKMRRKHGRNRKFNPETFAKAAEDYFKWIADNPLMSTEIVKYQGDASLVEVPKMHAMTIKGLCVFLNISEDTWLNYKKDEKFKPICEAVGNIIYEQKLTGAAADLLNGNIIGRELGLVDKSDTIIHDDVDWDKVGYDFATALDKAQMSKPEKK